MSRPLKARCRATPAPRTSHGPGVSAKSRERHERRLPRRGVADYMQGRSRDVRLRGRGGTMKHNVKPVGILGAAIAGAALMYLLDPRSGRRRRSVASQAVVHGAHELRGAAETTTTDLRNRSRGVVARFRGLGAKDVGDDRVISARVRSAIGRVASHPHAVDVFAEDGTVTLHGDVLDEEEHAVIHAARKTRGVHEVENRLARHQSAHAIPALQGGRRRLHRFELLQENWAPAPRLLAGTGGLLLAFAGARSSAPDPLRAVA